MSHIHRFFIHPPEDPETALLQGQEAHHALHVVRVRKGDEVALFDGAGRQWSGTVHDATRHDVQIRLGDEVTISRPTARLTLLQAWLHRDKSVEELIRRGTEIGISRFAFFPAHHSERRPSLSEKWQRMAIESCKQCGRLWLPEFTTADSLEAALGEAQGELLLATRDLEPVALRSALTGCDVALVVGPEGDFTESELGSLIAKGAKAISLGNVTFRAEVAAITAATAILYELGELGPR